MRVWRGYHFIGNDAHCRRGILTLKYPFHDPEAIHWETAQELWKYALEESLRLDPTEHTVLMTEPPYRDACVQAKTAEVMFEALGVPALSFQEDAVMGLVGGSGRLTGVYSTLRSLSKRLVAFAHWAADKQP